MVDIEPVIFIKDINYDIFINNYFQGNYNNKIITKKIKFKNIALIDNDYGNSLNDNKAYINIGNERIQNITDNILNYENFVRENSTNIMKGGICHWCRRKYEDYSLGVPIKIIQNKKNEIKYLVEGNYCCFECVYAGILSERHFRNLWKDSETILKIIFKEYYPNEKLYSSKDWKLLDINGGSLNEEQFFNGEKHLFIRTYNYIYPIKNIYS